MIKTVRSLFQKYRSELLYLFFGGLTFLVSVASFALFVRNLGINELIANVLSWILAVLFAFFTNRLWVFHAPTTGAAAFLKQMLSFFGGRLLTLGVEELLLFIFITRLRFSEMAVKIAAQILVIVLNYVISKLFVFQKTTE